VEFALNKRQKDKSTLRDNLETVERRTGRRHPLLSAAEDQPTALEYLFEVFADLSGVRRYSMSGPEPIGFDQIYFWQLANGFPLHKWERKAIIAADAAWRRTQQPDYSGPDLGADNGD
jgi:hypothetical protein